jgi:hypothetical protein
LPSYCLGYCLVEFVVRIAGCWSFLMLLEIGVGVAGGVEFEFGWLW